MKKQALGSFLVTLVFTVFLFSCQKNVTGDKENFDTEASDQTDDQTQFSAQIDATSDEVSAALETTGTMAFRGGGVSMETLGCGATLAFDSSNSTRTLTITYNGADCLGVFSRTGTVVVSIPSGVHWKDAGATITVQYQNVVVKRIRDNKSITISGSHTITNVSGGLLYNLANLNSITHRIASSNMSITFPNGSQRSWQVARQRVFTYNGGIIITITGTHTEGSVTGIAEWGTNRMGRAFTSAITQPLVVKQECSFRLVSGQIKHTLPVFSAVATFGLNANGEATSCPGNNPYYCKVIWTGAAGNSHTVIFPY